MSSKQDQRGNLSTPEFRRVEKGERVLRGGLWLPRQTQQNEEEKPGGSSKHLTYRQLLLGDADLPSFCRIKCAGEKFFCQVFEALGCNLLLS